MTKVTNEELGHMIAKGFSFMDEKLVDAEKERAAMEKRLDVKIEAVDHRLSTKIDAVDLKLSAQSSSWRDDFHVLDERVSLNETDIKALNNIVYKKN